ncbi:MAG TPA: MnmC family methyltransferase [Candidatus Limnocylindria bacterium]|nr:MnmC family methyltransferase [Candidatus Limnocylindria bacterium]
MDFIPKLGSVGITGTLWAVEVECGYEWVQLKEGAWSVRSLREQETFHPVVGPEKEAETLYVRQLNLEQRIASTPSPLVLWDVGLGAAANAIVALRHLERVGGHLQLLSFDHTLEPLRFAVKRPDRLSYLAGWEEDLTALAQDGQISRRRGALQIDWRVVEGDFPTLLESGIPLEAPHAIFFDAYSPATNTVMWTLPVFEGIFRRLNPNRPCSLATYSRSTLVRSTLLRAGFFVGSGEATGEKEETTIAANRPELVPRILGAEWLQRAYRSTSAEPLHGPHYVKKPLAPETREILERHPQFRR